MCVTERCATTRVYGIVKLAISKLIAAYFPPKSWKTWSQTLPREVAYYNTSYKSLLYTSENIFHGAEILHETLTLKLVQAQVLPARIKQHTLAGCSFLH